MQNLPSKSTKREHRHAHLQPGNNLYLSCHNMEETGWHIQCLNFFFFAHTKRLICSPKTVSIQSIVCTLGGGTKNKWEISCNVTPAFTVPVFFTQGQTCAHFWSHLEKLCRHISRLLYAWRFLTATHRKLGENVFPFVRSLLQQCLMQCPATKIATKYKMHSATHSGHAISLVK